MNFNIQLFLLVGIIFYTCVVIYLLVKQKLNLKYALIWFLTVGIMFVVTVFPMPIIWLAEVVGIETPTNLVFVIEGLFVLMILLSLTSIVSGLTNRIYRLTQTIAILEKRVRELESNQEKWLISDSD